MKKYFEPKNWYLRNCINPFRKPGFQDYIYHVLNNINNTLILIFINNKFINANKWLWINDVAKWQNVIWIWKRKNQILIEKLSRTAKMFKLSGSIYIPGKSGFPSYSICLHTWLTTQPASTTVPTLTSGLSTSTRSI